MDFPKVLLVLVLLVIPTYQISEIVTKTCDTTSYKEFCKSELGSAPETDVKDLLGLTTFALKVASLKGVEIHMTIDEIANSTNEDEFMQQSLNDCSEIYQDAIDQLEDSTAGIEAKTFNDVNNWIGAAMTDAQSCEDAFKEKDGAQSPLTEHTKNFTQLCRIALSFSNLLAQQH